MVFIRSNADKIVNVADESVFVGVKIVTTQSDNYIIQKQVTSLSSWARILLTSPSTEDLLMNPGASDSLEARTMDNHSQFLR